MKNYENFMEVSLNKQDIKNLSDYSGEYIGGFFPEPYSKIVIQFSNEVEFDRFLTNDLDTDMFVICHDWNRDKYQYILYSIDENAFVNQCEIFKHYECCIYQFIIE